MRVQLVTRGSWFMQETMLPKLRAPRIHMLFPLTGPLKSGVVSLQVGCVHCCVQYRSQLAVQLRDGAAIACETPPLRVMKARNTNMS